MRWNAPEDFQTRPHLLARTDDPFVSVKTRGLRGADRRCAFQFTTDKDAWFGPSRVRVNYRCVQLGLTERRRKDRPTRVRIPKGTRMVVGHELTFEVNGIAVRP